VTIPGQGPIRTVASALHKTMAELGPDRAQSYGWLSAFNGRALPGPFTWDPTFRKAVDDRIAAQWASGDRVCRAIHWYANLPGNPPCHPEMLVRALGFIFGAVAFADAWETTTQNAKLETNPGSRATPQT